VIILIDQKPERGIYAKVKDQKTKQLHPVRHSPLGASSHQKTSGSKHRQIKANQRPGTGAIQSC